MTYIKLILDYVPIQMMQVLYDLFLCRVDNAELLSSSENVSIHSFTRYA